MTFGAEARLAADVYVNATSVGGNFGSATSTYVGYSGNRRSFLRFDLSTLPPGTTATQVAKANLVLFADTATAGSTFNVVRITGAWVESTVTHSLAPALGTVEATAVPVGGTTKTFVSVDVTNQLRIG